MPARTLKATHTEVTGKRDRKPSQAALASKASQEVLNQLSDCELEESSDEEEEEKAEDQDADDDGDDEEERNADKSKDRQGTSDAEDSDISRYLKLDPEISAIVDETEAETKADSAAAKRNADKTFDTDEGDATTSKGHDTVDGKGDAPTTPLNTRPDDDDDDDGNLSDASHGTVKKATKQRSSKADDVNDGETKDGNTSGDEGTHHEDEGDDNDAASAISSSTSPRKSKAKSKAPETPSTGRKSAPATPSKAEQTKAKAEPKSPKVKPEPKTKPTAPKSPSKGRGKRKAAQDDDEVEDGEEKKKKVKRAPVEWKLEEDQIISEAIASKLNGFDWPAILKQIQALRQQPQDGEEDDGQEKDYRMLLNRWSHKFKPAILNIASSFHT